MVPPSDSRIAITGMGVVSPLGQGVDAYWNSLVQGRSGISAIERFDTSDMRVKRGGEIKQFAIPKTFVQPLPTCRASQFLITAATEALEMARWKGDLRRQ